MTIKKAAVIGSGVMGSGIAAQLANAGIEVELLDIVPKTGNDRDAIAKGAIEKMLKTNPAPLMHPKNAKLIRAGNTDDHLERLGDCDLIIEVVPENPAIKSATFKKIDAHRKAGSIVASNTSTIPLSALSADQSEQFKKDFVITHFFNPPRYMPLLELVTSGANDPAMVAEITRFMDEKMGKTVIACKDTPGFIANRIGTFWIQAGINEAIARGLAVEEADAIAGRPMGVPKSGVFGLVDLVGLDLMPSIGKSLSARLPADDAYVTGMRANPVIDKMIADGFIGRKGAKGGFYRLDENRNKLATDLATGDTRPAFDVKAGKDGFRKGKDGERDVRYLSALDASQKGGKKGGLKALFEHHDKYGNYAWSLFSQTLCYCAQHVHDISSGVTAIDDAMVRGYNWDKGPFEMLDALGLDYFINRMEAEGRAVPAFIRTAAASDGFYRVNEGKLQSLQQDGSYADIKRPDGVLLLSDIKRASKPVAVSNHPLRRVLSTLLKPFVKIPKMGAALWDVGDGVICLEFISKQNSIDFETMQMIHKACDLIEAGKFKALVIHNEAKDFSYGANLPLAVVANKLGQNWIIDKMVSAGQEAYKRLKYAKFPVVSAPAGKAIGGGCEILLHSNHVQAHAETYMGLVEVGVGLLPAWGGSAEMLLRATRNKKLPAGPMPAIAATFETISMAKVSISAQNAKDLMYLRATDGVTMNRSRLLADAKAKALSMLADPAQTYEEPQTLELPGPAGLAALRLAVDGMYQKGAITPYDVVVSDRVARVLTGGDNADIGVRVSQDELRRLERLHFMELIHDKRTINRIKTILDRKRGSRKFYEPVENAARGPRAPELIKKADAKKGGLLRRIFGGAVYRSHANDNAYVREGKAKVNWPGTGKKK